MKFISVYTFVDVIVVFLLLLFSVFLTQLRVGNRSSHLILAAFMLCLALSYMDGVFLSFGYVFHYSYAHMVYLTMSFDFLVGPLLYLYVLARTKPNFSWRPLYTFHFLAFAGHFCFLFFRYHSKSIEEKRSLLETHQVFSASEILTLTSVSNLHYLGYMVLILFSLWQYQQTIKRYYSNIHRKNLHWLFLISCGVLFAGLMRFSNNLLWLKTPDAWILQLVDLKLVAITCILVFACTVVYKSLQQPDILRIPPDFLTVQTGDAESQAAAVDKTTANKYKTTLLPIDKKSEYLKNLNDYMHSQKPYLNAELTLAELATSVGIPAHHLSQVINSEYGKNFYDFINGYRLQEAVRLLKEADNQDKYITQIMYDAGFNSKSVFNTAFKKEFGQTPSAFRKNLRASQPVT